MSTQVSVNNQSNNSDLLPVAHDILRNIFGFDKFFDYQQEVIRSVINDNSNCLVFMPTGSGKSLCYQIPALVFNQLTLVVSPLIALMIDQVKRLQSLKVEAGFLASTLSDEEINVCYDNIICGKIKILYLTPEKLSSHSFIKFISRCKVALLAIDEAHCVSQWGHDFRPEYQKISDFIKTFPNMPRIALTATMDQYVIVDIKHRLQLERAQCFIGSRRRDHFIYSVEEKHNAKKQLVSFLLQHMHESGIIYCMTRNNANKLYDYLLDNGFDVCLYHAGVAPEIRHRNYLNFTASTSKIMVATVAFGLGIDKPDIRFVYHFDMPSSIEQFYQESGRAGRDGGTAFSVVNFGFKEIIHSAHMIINSDLDVVKKRYELVKLKNMVQYCQSIDCRAYILHGDGNGCGLCDNCKHKKVQVDHSVHARQVLFTVKQIQMGCNIGILLDILRGKITVGVKVGNYHVLPTFGALQGIMTIKDLRRFIRSLYARDYLDIDHKTGNFILGHNASRLVMGQEDFLFK